MDIWYPAAQRDPAPVNGGAFLTGVPYRGVLHTTESFTYKPRSDRTYYGHRYWPHFTPALEDGRFIAWQHLPINVAGRALENDIGGVQTNRWRAIQLEICWKAAIAHEMPDELVDGIAALMRWIERQTGIRRAARLFQPYPPSYGPRGRTNTVRMTDAEWKAYDGWCGHQHIPENSHGDPGSLPITRLLAVPRPAQEDEDEMKQRYQVRGQREQWVLEPGGAVHINSGETVRRLTKEGRLSDDVEFITPEQLAELRRKDSA